MKDKVENLALVFVSLALGALFRKMKVFPSNMAHALNRFVIYVSLPALTLKLMHSLRLDVDSLVPVLTPWILFGVGFLFFYGVARWTRWGASDRGALILTGSLGNTSFVGFPLLEAFFGTSALATGILVDQPGTFLAASTLGILTASFHSGKSAKASDVARKVFSFPPFLAILLSLILRPFPIPGAVMAVLDRLGGTLAPLALLAVGLQLHFDRASLKRERLKLFWGLGFKLLLAPLFFVALYRGVLHLGGEAIRITLVESAMAPMITAGILANEYNLNPELANLMIGIGIPLSLLTTYLWSIVLK